MNHYDSFFAGIFVMILYMLGSIVYYENVLDTTLLCVDCYGSIDKYIDRIEETWTGILLIIPLLIVIRIVKWKWDK